jgi:hypothetical protein
MSLLKAKSAGVTRLSLVAGLLAVIYHLATLNEPFGPPAQTPGHPWQNLLVNLSEYALEAVLYFLVAWGSVRIIAWIVAGFVSDTHRLKDR